MEKDDGQVSDVDSSMERYKVRQNRNYERKAQKMETSRSKVSTEADKRMEAEIVHLNWQKEAERTNLPTSMHSDELDPKFTQPTEVDG